MPDDWFTIRRQARRDIHAAFSLSADYTDTVVIAPVTLKVRWLNRFGVPVGDIPGGDYAQVFDSIDRLRFDVDELADYGITPRRGGQVVFTQYGYTFRLDNREPGDGPVTQTWTVSK